MFFDFKITYLYNFSAKESGKERDMEKSPRSAVSNKVLKAADEKRESFILYKNKNIPKSKEYRLEIAICQREVEAFIKILSEKFREGIVQVIEHHENSYKILIEGEKLEDTSCILKVNLQGQGEASTKIELDSDFKPYYRKILKLGLIGVLVVFSILTISIGALDLRNVLSLGYLFGSIGLFGISLLILGVFVWNKSLAFQSAALEALYRRLDSREGEVIDQALQRFREKQIKEISKQKVDTCYQCNALIPSQREKGELLCGKCQNLLLTCAVCLLNIGHGEPIILCPHCNAPAHRDHLREWLKIKNFCPYCKQPIREEELKETS